MNNKNRGMLLEGLINKTIDFYKENEIGIFHKKEIPIKFSSIGKENGKLIVNNAFVSKKSTIDYYGVSNGFFYAFEAKSTNELKLPLKNIKRHQIEYLLSIKDHGGKSFFIIGFISSNEFYLIEPESIMEIESSSLSIEKAREIGKQIKLLYPGILDFVHLA